MKDKHIDRIEKIVKLVIDMIMRKNTVEEEPVDMYHFNTENR